jgi:signal transduction histidine kinase
MDPLRPPLLRRLRPAHWFAIDCVITALLALVYAVGFGAPANLTGIPQWAAAVIAAGVVLPAGWRRRWPRTVLALVAVSWAVATAVSVNPEPPLVVAFVMYLIPLRFPRRDALRLLAGTLVVIAAGLVAFATVPHGIYRTGGTDTALGLLLESGLLVIAAWLAGYWVRQQHAYTAGLREQGEQRAREQLAEARRAISEERLQIARELHDVVAHTMSLIAVQAGVANYVVKTHPEEAARALSSIEETSRGALGEMRALLGVLRADATQSDHGAEAGSCDPGRLPAPGLADLDSLVERTAEAGVRVDLEVRGERPGVSAGLDLAVYRVIQEALTNVIKHAATDSCRVAVTYRKDALTLEVTDDGKGAGWNGGGHDSPAAGHGIVGMRERVVMYGGTFDAGPRPGRGFRVTARLPLAATGPASTAPASTGPASTGPASTGPAGDAA